MSWKNVMMIFLFVALIILAPGPSVRAQHTAAWGCMENGHMVWYDHAVTCGSSAAPSAGSSAVDTLSPLMQQAVTNFFTWLFSSNPKQDQQQKAFLEEAERRRVEAEQQRILEEQRRREELFRRLSRELKLDGLPGLHLKGMESSQALKLKGLEGATQGSNELKLKLGGDDGSKPYGIPGLPGTYTGGGRDSNTNSASVQGTQDNSPNKNNELRLKLGDEQTKSTTSQVTDKVAEPPVAAAQQRNGVGIPGLPGVYLDGANQGDATKLAAAAQKLSGPDREVAEETALDAASRNPALTAASQDPSVNSFQQARAEYEQARQAQASAADVYKAAQTRHDATQSVLDLARSEVEKGDPTSAAPTVAGKQEALANLVAGARTDEEAWESARKGFDTATTNLGNSRSKAVNALAAMASATGTPVVDLRGAKEPLIVPSDLKAPAPGPDRVSPAGAAAIQPEGPPKSPMPSIPSIPFSGPPPNTAIQKSIEASRTEIKVIQQVLRNLEKVEQGNDAERHALEEDIRKAGERARMHLVEMFTAGVIDWSKGNLREQLAITNSELGRAEDQLYGELDPGRRERLQIAIKMLADHRNDILTATAVVKTSDAAVTGAKLGHLAGEDRSSFDKSLEVIHTSAVAVLDNPKVQKVLSLTETRAANYVGVLKYGKDAIDSVNDVGDQLMAIHRLNTDVAANSAEYLTTVGLLRQRTKDTVEKLNKMKALAAAEQTPTVP